MDDTKISREREREDREGSNSQEKKKKRERYNDEHVGDEGGGRMLKYCEEREEVLRVDGKKYLSNRGGRSKSEKVGKEKKMRKETLAHHRKTNGHSSESSIQWKLFFPKKNNSSSFLHVQIMQIKSCQSSES
jgi:hypothetical protein